MMKLKSLSVLAVVLLLSSPALAQSYNGYQGGAHGQAGGSNGFTPPSGHEPGSFGALPQGEGMEPGMGQQSNNGGQFDHRADGDFRRDRREEREARERRWEERRERREERMEARRDEYREDRGFDHSQGQNPYQRQSQNQNQEPGNFNRQAFNDR